MLTSSQTNLARCTVVELVAITFPLGASLVLGVSLFSLPIALLGWFGSGLAGLMVALSASRTSKSDYSLVQWPRPQTMGDILINGIAYNSVVLLGTILAQVVWLASKSTLLGVGIGVILPLWFLKHVHLLVFLGES